MDAAIAHHSSLQAGVVSRRQALKAGLDPHDVRRLLRRREWAILHPGVYVTHTGPPTWLQRAWAGVLLAWPAALCHDSAMRAGDGPGARDRLSEELIHVGVDRQRASRVVPPGVRLHHLTRFRERVLWNLGPPRLRYEDAALDVAAAATTDFAAIAALAKACQSRRTTAQRLLDTLAERPRIPRRLWLEGTPDDVTAGTCSALEHGCLNRVERRHSLPRADRQVRAAASVGVVYRDAEYGRRFIVELGGRLFHDSATQRDADFERDLDAAVDGKSTLRLSWGQVLDRPCSTASKVVRVLQAHGIVCHARARGPDCAVGLRGLAA